MQISRYLDIKAFISEASKLKVVHGSVTPGLLEHLEEQGLLKPKLRLRYPDKIERRWWRDGHRGVKIAGPVEPDGERWKLANALERARCERHLFTDPRVDPQPLDDIPKAQRRFVQHPARRKFTPWDDYHVRVAGTVADPLMAHETVVTYYSSWQLLQFAEATEMGVRVLINIEQSGPRPTEQQIAEAPRSISFMPVYALRGLRQHARALDAAIWFAEEAQRGYLFATASDHRRRVPSDAERAEIMATRIWAAQQTMRRHCVRLPALIAAIGFLTEQWAHWNREGRPLIADTYKTVAAQMVRLACLAGKFDVAEVSRRVGLRSGYFKPIIEVIWPDWAVDQRDDARRIIVGYSRPSALLKAGFTPDLADRFLDFIEQKKLHNFFWRLESFHRHAFKGNDYSLPGLKADVQGMALVVEHLATELGATRLQLNAKFKQLWTHRPDVMKLLKNNQAMKVGNGEGIDLDWHEARQALGSVEEIAADLAIAYAIRGGAHHVIAEANPLKVERMMLILLRAAVRTFDEATAPAPVPISAPAPPAALVPRGTAGPMP